MVEHDRARTAPTGNCLGVKEMGQPKPEPRIVGIDAGSTGQQIAIPVRPHLARVGRENLDWQVWPLVGAVTFQTPSDIAPMAASPPDTLG